MNALTNKWVLVEDKLFATLWTSVGELYYPSMTGKWDLVLINDTIGFIRDLPPGLIEAFRSTLEDSIEADLLLHVVDSTDVLVFDKIDVVDEILTKIGATQPRLLIFNKADALSEEKRHELMANHPDAMFVSAVAGEWLEQLKEALYLRLFW